jgi:UDP-N-acetylmuramate dehydrogenase
MNIRKNISLKNYNTFSIDVNASEFVEIKSLDDLQQLREQAKLDDVFVLSGGSNMLLTKDIETLVVRIDIKGIKIESENANSVVVSAMAGEDWPEFVKWTVGKGFHGLENLTDIPGRVGSSPIQNIGAYGVELKDSFLKLEAFNLESGEIEVFDNSDCEFAYRESVFKGKLKGKYIIVKVYFDLSKNAELKLDYGAITSVLQSKNITNPNISDLSACISEIRASKLPDPKEIGNSGSFFKNPVISVEHFESLKSNYADIPSYTIDENSVKVPAGWLIDKVGWKGYRNGDAGVHKNQALVLVNYGNASGSEIYQLAREIQKDIFKKFGVELSMEVNLF